MTVASPATGAGWVLPTLPRRPAHSTESAAAPVVGHGSDGSAPGRRTDVDTVGTNAGDGTGPNHRTPTRATSATTTAPAISSLWRATFRSSMYSSSSVVTGMRSPSARSRSSLAEERREGRCVGSGAKVLVPKANTVDIQHRDALLTVAGTTRSNIVWEGSAWTGATSLAPRDLLRHALVVPRLVAPHPNAGTTAPLVPEQAVAMLVQSRLRDLDRFAQVQAEVPTLTEAAASTSWRWRYVGALGKPWGFSRSVRKAPAFYGLVALGTIGGTALSLLQVNPIKLLVFVAVLNGVIAAPFLVVVMFVSSNRKLMGDYVNGKAAKVLGWSTAILMAVAAIALFATGGISI